MMKPASLRAALVALVPDLADNPDRLLVFADAGTVTATPGVSLSLLAGYTLNAILLDFAGDANQVFAGVVEWVKVNQRDLVENRERHKDGITFEVDFLNHATYDLSIKLKVTESVVATRGADGQLVTRAKAEPVPEWDKTGLFGG